MVPSRTRLQVPSGGRMTPRSAADHISAVGGPTNRGRGTPWPIGDLPHARLALTYALSPSHAGVRAKVARAVARNYPAYDWARWWNAHAQGKNLPTWDELMARSRRNSTLSLDQTLWKDAPVLPAPKPYANWTAFPPGFTKPYYPRYRVDGYFEDFAPARANPSRSRNMSRRNPGETVMGLHLYALSPDGSRSVDLDPKLQSRLAANLSSFIRRAYGGSVTYQVAAPVSSLPNPPLYLDWAVPAQIYDRCRAAVVDGSLLRRSGVQVPGASLHLSLEYEFSEEQAVQPNPSMPELRNFPSAELRQIAGNRSHPLCRAAAEELERRDFAYNAVMEQEQHYAREHFRERDARGAFRNPLDATLFDRIARTGYEAPWKDSEQHFFQMSNDQLKHLAMSSPSSFVRLAAKTELFYRERDAAGKKHKPENLKAPTFGNPRRR